MPSMFSEFIPTTPNDVPALRGVSKAPPRWAGQALARAASRLLTGRGTPLVFQPASNSTAAFRSSFPS